MRDKVRLSSSKTFQAIPRNPHSPVVLNVNVGMPFVQDEHTDNCRTQHDVPILNTILMVRSSNLRAYVKKRRWIIGIIIIMMIVGLLLGLIFAARRYYLRMTSQGTLGARQESSHSILLPPETIVASITPRSTKNNVPYYACGDQLHNCGAFNQPVSTSSSLVEV